MFGSEPANLDVARRPREAHRAELGAVGSHISQGPITGSSAHVLSDVVGGQFPSEAGRLCLPVDTNLLSFRPFSGKSRGERGYDGRYRCARWESASVRLGQKCRRHLRHSCHHWEWWDIPAAYQASGVYVQAIRNTPCPSCYARQTALRQARRTVGDWDREYAREFLRCATG